MKFETHLGHHTVKMDTVENFGGHDEAPMPKSLLLASLSGCTGMDVVSILKKMQVKNYQLQIECSAKQSDEHPKIFTEINLKYVFKGKDLPLDKIEKAVDLSFTKYCGVTAMLQKSSILTKEIEVLSF
ncbi:OsmC family protein [candidate division WOR-3 bacterium]|nr:OsmC family protein [candidate division WOR-3 bacterium]